MARYGTYSVWEYQSESEPPCRIGGSSSLERACQMAIKHLQKGENGWFTEVEEALTGDIYATYRREGPGYILDEFNKRYVA